MAFSLWFAFVVFHVVLLLTVTCVSCFAFRRPPTLLRCLGVLVMASNLESLAVVSLVSHETNHSGLQPVAMTSHLDALASNLDVMASNLL